MEIKRTRMVAGNWKMNLSYEEGRDLAQMIVDRLQPTGVKVVLATPYIHLKNVGNIVMGIKNVFLGAQNVHQEEKGAYTGEISAAMLNSVGVRFVIVGHSERREYFKETDKQLAAKVKRVIDSGMKVIFCCGEKLKVREEGTQEALVAQQLQEGLFHLEEADLAKIVIAYEPIWAIGTGKNASPKQAQEMHKAIRKMVAERYSPEVAAKTVILYGGSCKPSNARELFSQEDVDGGLIGGASLKAEDFVDIINSF